MNKSKRNKWEILFDQFLEIIGFRLVKYRDGWGLIDKQGANLGEIEDDRSTDAMGVLDRLDIYIEDYIAKDVEEVLNDDKIDDWSDLVNAAKERMTLKQQRQCRLELDILDMICNHPTDIDLEKCQHSHSRRGSL